MARGVDELVNFLLSEIALTGVQGAGSTDFKRFVEAFYKTAQDDTGLESRTESTRLGRPFYERVWLWVSNHTDIRIIHNGGVHQYSLAEFEAAENAETRTNSAAATAQSIDPASTAYKPAPPANSLLGLRDSMRQRLAKEGLYPQTAASITSSTQQSLPLQDLTSARSTDKILQAPHRTPRILPTTGHDGQTIFDDPPTTTTAPRLYASQSRIWQALTGHGIDLKKVPTMEFVLLSLIASHGAAGVTQPDLTVISGQDKRSVPHRTDELCRKGYIEKRPVQAGKLRTSLCVHQKFVSDDHFLTSGKVEDVFQYKKFVVSGFVHLLYNTLKDAGIVPTRDIRKRLNVPMSTWNKRAVQGALIRLDQTGMIKRFRARRKATEDNWLTCIEVLREPRPEDHENLKFRRQATLDEAAEEQSDDEVDGDTMMRDLEVDMLNSQSQDVDDGKEVAGRIPPQWVPERLLSNILHEVVAMGGSGGWDSGELRDRIVGKFWRRPMESYLSRLTDDWEKTQPAHLRHLALIKDTRNTQEKKFVHYVYRTYGNFQKAVDAGEAIWAGVSKPAPKQASASKGGRPKKQASTDQPIDGWGFRILSPKDLFKGDGSASLSECRTAIIHGRKYGPRWDNALSDDIGYQKLETPRSERQKWTNDMSRSRQKLQLNLEAFVTPKPANSQMLGNGTASGSEEGTPAITPMIMGVPKRKHEAGLLTIEQRIALGLKPKGRLSKHVEDQVREHRKRTGDPVSIPDSIVNETPVSKPTAKHGPLMTKEERIAAGLPARGRLGQKMEDQIREQRGLPKSVEKVKKPRNRPTNEPALLSKQQRIQFGIIPHGRLPQALMEGLREERDFEIPLEQSKVLQAYLDAVKEKKATPAITMALNQVRLQILRENDPSYEETHHTSVPSDDDGQDELSLATTPLNIGKRKPDEDAALPQPLKKICVEHSALQEDANVDERTPESTASASVDRMPSECIAEESAVERADDRATLNTVVESPQPPHRTPVPSLDLYTTTAELSTQSASVDYEQAAILPRGISADPGLTEMDPKVQLVKEKYDNRSSSGIYINPFARRKVAKGRPRNAFIATFRLVRLKELDWFIANTYEGHAEPTPNAKQSPHDETTDALASPPSSYQQSDSETQSMQHSTAPVCDSESLESMSHIEPQSNKQAVSTDRETLPQAEASLAHDETMLNDDQASLAGTREGECSEGSITPGQGANGLVTSQHLTRPVAGWTAINLPSQPQSAYQSPYAPPGPSDSVISPERLSEDDTDEQSTENNAEDSQIQGVFGPITEADMVEKSARKPVAHMGTKAGGGTQKVFRHRIIRQIIDLCDGVYPLHGEIGRPFVTLWKQQHPTYAPPNSTTVLSNLREMIADPNSGLKKFSFLIRLRQSAGLKKKDMVVYQHLTPNSPQVMRLAYKMANFSNTKAHQYYPDEIRHLISAESFYVPMPVAPKDETISLELLNPSLQDKIKEANLERRRRYYHKQRDEETARDAQNAAVEAPPKQAAANDGNPRAKRTRLASLNDKNKRYRRAPVTKQPSEPADDEEAERVLGETSLKDYTPERSHSLVWKEPWIAPVVRPKALSPQPEPNPSTFTRASRRNSPTEHLTSSITAPIIRFYSTIGTYSTEFGLVRESDGFGLSPLRWPAVDTVAKPKGTKRVRIAEPSPEPPNKKVRTGAVDIQSTNKEEHVTISSEESEDHYSSSSTSTSDEEDATSLSSSVKAKAKARVKAKAKSKTKKQRDKKPPPPTLLERLTGLTGDLDGPVYQPPKPKSQIQKTYQGWAERKKAQFNKQQRERKYAESQDPVDKFKKLCCTLVIAASMADGDGCVDWSIVEKVHNTKGFNLPRTKTLWGWMQTNMAPEIATLTADFEARFLEAYEDGRIAAIEDPAAYDWANLIRWAMHHCIYPELSLPVYREALRHFIVDLSSFEVLDRPKWYREKTADRVRTQLQLWYPFTAPLHRSGTPKFSVDERELKARSWIRANTATPQALYDSKTAHEKLSTLGNTVLAKVVGEYVHRQMLRMRKLKRLLPGRNYTFTARLAKKYGRTFELGDFMAAVKIKKDMDAAFKQEDREKRIYSLSRAEPDGAIMAVMTLLSEGKVRFVPKLPSVNSEFGAPLPRLSVWGFCEGDYVHRGIDRQRLFWDVHVVPTSSYDYGNPLQPSHDLSLGERTYCPETWSPLPQPPLPGKYDSNALLPIWSSMDGQNITWPWWYRILNLVLQPLIFQPGATVEDIHDNCDEYTTEIFEIKLVLQWLISVKAVKMTVGGGYITMPGVWATFGDVLHDMNDDWLNAHVRRKHNKQQKQQWRESYHLRYSALQGRNGQQDLSGDSGDSDTQTDDEHDALTSTRLNIIRHPKAQYAILREQVEARTPVRTTVGTETANTVEQTIRLTAASKHDVDQSNDFNSPAVHNEDIDMEDADGETEANAEWEVGG